jgi:hypothetical protein
MTYSYKEVRMLIMYGGHISDFDQWTLANENGWSAAHCAATCGRLPVDFNQWDIADANGRTVGHTAALFGHLPKDYSQWELADEDGITVAHEAAKRRSLPVLGPKDFDLWYMADNNGKTVAKCALESGLLSEDEYANICITNELDIESNMSVNEDANRVDMV